MSDHSDSNRTNDDITTGVNTTPSPSDSMLTTRPGHHSDVIDSLSIHGAQSSMWAPVRSQAPETLIPGSQRGAFSNLPTSVGDLHFADRVGNNNKLINLFLN